MNFSRKKRKEIEKKRKRQKKATRREQRERSKEEIRKIPENQLSKAIDMTEQRMRDSKLEIPEEESREGPISQRGSLLSLGLYLYHHGLNVPDYKSLRDS